MTVTDTPQLRAWIRELRDGGHQQTNGILRRESWSDADFDKPAEFRYCCLGVAKEHVLHGECGDAVNLTHDEFTVLGLEDADHRMCMAMNDSMNLTFAEIADRLEYAVESGISLRDSVIWWVTNGMSMSAFMKRLEVVGWVRDELKQGTDAVKQAKYEEGRRRGRLERDVQEVQADDGSTND